MHNRLYTELSVMSKQQNTDDKSDWVVFIDADGDAQQIQTEKSSSKDEDRKELPTISVDQSSQRKRYMSLIILAGQNAILVLVTRYSRILPGDRYFSTTAVCMQELVKLIASMLMIILYEGGLRGLTAQINNHIINDPWDNLRVSVPAVLYVVQNNLFYIAVSNLPAATFQVLFQTRILTTALFATLIMQQKLSAKKWISLFILTSGIAAVQLEGTVSSEPAAEGNSGNHNAMIGFGAILVMCLTSGFSGVYLEKILKRSEGSLWLRNIQLALFGLILGMGGVLINDGRQIMELGFFYGYNRWTIAVIFNQALGGLIIACVVKYADNILKGFATSMAVIISCLVSVYLFDFQLTPIFLVGAAMVVGSACLYNVSK